MFTERFRLICCFQTFSTNRIAWIQTTSSVAWQRITYRGSVTWKRKLGHIVAYTFINICLTHYKSHTQRSIRELNCDKSNIYIYNCEEQDKKKQFHSYNNFAHNNLSTPLSFRINPIIDNFIYLSLYVLILRQSLLIYFFSFITDIHTDT